MDMLKLIGTGLLMLLAIAAIFGILIIIGYWLYLFHWTACAFWVCICIVCIAKSILEM